MEDLKKFIHIFYSRSTVPDYVKNKLSSSNTVAPSPTESDNEVHIFESIASPNRPGVYLITFEDYFSFDLQQRLTLNGYEYKMKLLKYEYDRRDTEQELKKILPWWPQVGASRSLTDVHVNQRSSFNVFIPIVLWRFISMSFTIKIRPLTSCYYPLWPLFRRFPTTKHDHNAVSTKTARTWSYTVIVYAHSLS